MMLISAEQFINLLLRLNENQGAFDEIIVPYRVNDSLNSNWGKLDEKRKSEIILNSYRTLLPLKFLFYPPRETLFPERSDYPKRLIVGVKACDLQSLDILDSALLKSNFVEPAYSKWRENTTIISSDCNEISPSCHCTLLNGKPYSTEDFDLNISEVSGYYLLTSGSERGKQLLEQMKMEIRSVEPGKTELQHLKENRDYMVERVHKQNSAYFPVNKSDGLRSTPQIEWANESKECVGCGACTNSCPTCYCLILNDESMSDEFVKVRSYDSCQWFGYARVAGGGTPRPKMHQRFRNRYLCKFDYMQSNFQKPGCTGCGRCIDSCTAEIDFRSVLRKTEEYNKEPILF